MKGRQALLKHDTGKEVTRIELMSRHNQNMHTYTRNESGLGSIRIVTDFKL